MRNNLFYNNAGQLVYNAGCLGVVHNVAENRQKFLLDHKNPVISIAIHPNGETFATGELAPRPAIHVWDSKTLKLLSIVKQGLSKGADNLSFSTDSQGRFLLASMMGQPSRIIVFEKIDTHNYEMITVDDASNSPVMAALWLSPLEFLAVGTNLFKYWSIGEDLTSTEGAFNPQLSSLLTCAAKCPNGDVVCGTSDGQLQVWVAEGKAGEKKGRQVVNLMMNISEDEYSGSVDSILVTKSEILVAGSACKFAIFNLDYTRNMIFDIYADLSKPIDSQIKAMALNPEAKKIAFGLLSGEICELTYK
jgi:WD40 repeat protein